jgi:predicted CXXCH cytochrome family protein
MGVAPTLCYGCHDRIDEKRYVHGPLAVGDCLVCHDPHRGYGAAHLRREQALLCGNCHAARENSATVVCNAAGKACVDCHDPHQSDTRYLLKGPQYTMR